MLLFLGVHCEFPTCESAPCQNNGTCMPDSARGFSCDCSGTGRERKQIRILDFICMIMFQVLKVKSVW